MKTAKRNTETMEEAKHRMSSLLGLRIIEVGQLDGQDAVKLSNGTFLIVSAQTV